MNRNMPYATQWVDKEDIRAVGRILSSSYLTQGPCTQEFETKVAKYCGAKYALALNSGTSALHAACFAAGITIGDEVITSAITFVASANCILYCGGKPVFADIIDDTVNIDPEMIRKKINPRTKAIIPVHFAGAPCDLAEIRFLARKHKLIVIEDAAHALGAEYKGSKIGSGKYSDMTVLSFHAVKHITTGEGGMVLTNNKKFYERILIFRSHGITRNSQKLIHKGNGPWYYEMHHLGYNYRITDLQCALGLSQLKKLNKFIARRRKIAAMYNSAFKDMPGIILPGEGKDAKSSWHLYVIRLKNKRERIFTGFRQAGIGVNLHYIPVYLQPYYRQLGYKKGLCPRAENYYKQTITLPLYPRMSERDVRRVIRVTKSLIS